MTDILAQVEQCYTALLDPTGSRVKEASDALEKFYQEPTAFEVLMQVLRKTSNDSIRKHAVVGIGCFVRKYYRDLPADQQHQAFTELVSLMFHESSEYVRRYSRGIVSTCMTGEFVSTVQGIVANAAQGSEVQLEAALFLQTMCVAYVTDVQAFLALSIAMIQRGVQSSNVAVQVATVLHSLNICSLLPDDSPEGQQFFEYAVRIFAELAQAGHDYNDELNEIHKLICFAVDEEVPFVNVNALLQTCLTLLSSENVSFEAKGIVQIVSDFVVINHVDELVQNPEIVQLILKVYVDWAVASLNADDAFDLTNHNVFSAVAVEFSKYPEVLDMILQAMTQLVQDPATRYAVVVILYYVFENDDYFSDKIEQVSDLLIACLKDTSSRATREASARAIAQLAERQKDAIIDKAAPFITGLCEVMNAEPSAEYIKAIAAVVAAVKNIGGLFDNLLAELVKYLAIQDPAIIDSVFSCIRTLVVSVPKKARHHFQQIFELMQKALAADAMDALKPTAISCISHLAEINKQMFLPLAPQFLEFLAGSLDSNDDMVVKEAISAFGRLIQTIPEAVEGCVGDLLKKLVTISMTEITLDAENDDDTFMGTDTDTTPLEAKVMVVTSAIRTMCCTVSVFTQLLPEYFGPISQAIERQVAVGSADHVIACARGAVFLVEGFQKIGLNEQTKSFVVKLVQILADIVSSELSQAEGAGQGFEAIADIIAIEEGTGFLLCTGSIDKILAAIQSVFTGQMLYQQAKSGGEEGHVEWDEELLPPAQRILREIMASIKDKSVPILQQFIPLMNNLVSFPKKAMRDLALQFFGDLVFWAPGATDDELKRNVLILAVDAIQTRQSAIGFGCVKQLAMTAPHIVEPHVGMLLGLIKNRLDVDEGTEKAMTVQDNCVAALGKIAIVIMKDAFPLGDFLLPVLAHMPPQVEVEENNDALEFMRWLLERAQGQNIPEFAAVLVRLFADGLDKMDEYQVSAENVAWGRQLLREMLAKIPNAEAFVEQVCEEDSFKVEAVRQAVA